MPKNVISGQFSVYFLENFYITKRFVFEFQRVVWLNIPSWPALWILEKWYFHISVLFLINPVFWSDWLLVPLTQYLEEFFSIGFANWSVMTCWMMLCSSIKLTCTTNEYLFVGSMKIRELDRCFLLFADSSKLFRLSITSRWNPSRYFPLRPQTTQKYLIRIDNKLLVLYRTTYWYST